jgi:energy-coupling factor transport system permease protein
MEETEMIRKAQTARGARFESPRLKEKAESIMPLVIPIFISAFKRADELALAMEARGYRGGGQQIKKAAGPLGKSDFAAMLFAAAICWLQIFAL